MNVKHYIHLKPQGLTKIVPITERVVALVVDEEITLVSVDQLEEERAALLAAFDTVYADVQAALNK